MQKISIMLGLLLFGILLFGCTDLTTKYVCMDGSIKLDPSECEGNGDNTIYCTPNWLCSAWVNCTSEGKQTRVCKDKSGCGITTGKPIESQECTYICEPFWSCNEWSDCSSEGMQTRTCIDKNDCSVSTGKPAESQLCTPTCTPYWECDDWDACSPEGTQVRNCKDMRGCGVNTGRPAESQSCTYTCTPSWSCSVWLDCTSDRTQIRDCIDNNYCGVNTGRPAESQSCTYTTCTPSWSCSSWSTCSGNTQTRTCTDNNNCGVNTGRPAESQSCISNDITIDYHFTYYDNKEPYYSVFCDKIDPYASSIQQATAEAIQNDPGSYSIAQLLDIYDWVKKNIVYQTSPLAGIPYPPTQTLATRSGDCKNQAVLIASMIKIIGGTAKVVSDPDCVHAYTIVYFGSISTGISSFTRAVADHYGSQVYVNYFTLEGGIWVIFDPAGGFYPGDTLPECYGDRVVYYTTTCLSCAHQYPNSPYTYGDKCYSQCPSGTVHRNDYSCVSCDEGEWAYNNQCVTCQAGYYLATDGLCYPE